MGQVQFEPSLSHIVSSNGAHFSQLTYHTTDWHAGHVIEKNADWMAEFDIVGIHGSLSDDVRFALVVVVVECMVQR